MSFGLHHHDALTNNPPVNLATVETRRAKALCRAFVAVSAPRVPRRLRVRLRGLAHDALTNNAPVYRVAMETPWAMALCRVRRRRRALLVTFAFISVASVTATH